MLNIFRNGRRPSSAVQPRQHHKNQDKVHILFKPMSNKENVVYAFKKKTDVFSLIANKHK
jgi:hypothetical protein